MRFTLPDGAKVVSAPQTVVLEHPIGARFTASSKADAQTIELTRSVRLSPGRVSPAEYAQFAAFCRAVDLAEANELVIQLP
jgi:hypothetical protein